MKTPEFEQKYKALQEEAKALAAELKPFVKRYRSICKKASALGYKADGDMQLYKKIPVWYNEKEDWEPDGWNTHVIFRLTDFYGAEEWVQDACNILLNLKDEPFHKQTRKRTNLAVANRQKIVRSSK